MVSTIGRTRWEWAALVGGRWQRVLQVEPGEWSWMQGAFERFLGRAGKPPKSQTAEQRHKQLAVGAAIRRGAPPDEIERLKDRKRKKGST